MCRSGYDAKKIGRRAGLPTGVSREWIDLSVRRADIRVDAARSRMIEDRLRHPAVAVEQGPDRRPVIIGVAIDPRSIAGPAVDRPIVTRSVDASVLRIGRRSQRRGENRQSRDHKPQSHGVLLMIPKHEEQTGARWNRFRAAGTP